MITREEAKMVMDELFDQQDQLRQYIKSLESQLANTEQLTCQQCKHFTEASEEDFESCIFDFDCRDDYKPVSRFEEKDTQ